MKAVIILYENILLSVCKRHDNSQQNIQTFPQVPQLAVTGSLGKLLCALTPVSKQGYFQLALQVPAN